MGTWQSVVRENDLEEATAGDGVASTARYPAQGEGYCYVVKRTDAGANNEPWKAILQVSVDVAAGEWVDLRTQRREYDDTLIAFPVRGPLPAIRIFSQNDDADPDDKVKVDVDFQRDAVNI
jgi:hypothetical protein